MVKVALFQIPCPLHLHRIKTPKFDPRYASILLNIFTKRFRQESYTFCNPGIDPRDTTPARIRKVPSGTTDFENCDLSIGRALRHSIFHSYPLTPGMNSRVTRSVVRMRTLSGFINQCKRTVSQMWSSAHTIPQKPQSSQFYPLP
jgi:hypothetical protein